MVMGQEPGSATLTLREVVARHLATEDGRARVYAAIWHPLKTRLDYYAAHLGLEVVSWDRIAAKDLWPLLAEKAGQQGGTETEAFLDLVDSSPEFRQTLVHPFVKNLVTRPLMQAG